MSDIALVTSVVAGPESSMAIFTPKLDLDELNALFARAFPGAGQSQTILVTSVEPGRIRMTGRYREGLLRPGGVISGPTLMSLADSAAYALVLAHIGDQLMAVTSQLNMSFLRGAKPGDMHAEAELLRLGRRLAVCDIRIWTESPDRLAAQANVTYAIPG
ncbi:PaaI family thioesterase [Phenylobacterium sp.]|jgi:uncharacterized protein (TIGR00369 family)|uniref:PaaI family thioesterase n=1 Tax=Phenylobacterium sp. TaxID=1871053 RepID=UPI0037C90478